MKSRLAFWMILVLMVSTALYVRVRLVSLPLERDEGEYAYAAQTMLQGGMLYQDVYVLKFPGAHLLYAVLLKVGGQTDMAIRWGFIWIHGIMLACIFWIGRSLGSLETGIWSMIVFAISSLGTSLLGLTANSEYGVILMLLLGLCFLVQVTRRVEKHQNRSETVVHPSIVPYLGAGICFGLAILMKQHGVYFLIVPAFWLGKEIRRNRSMGSETRMSWWGRGSGFCFGLGVVLVLAVTALVLMRKGVWPKFWFWTMIYPLHYGMVWEAADRIRHFGTTFIPLLHEEGPFFLLSVCGMVCSWMRNRFLFWVFVLGWVASFLAVTPGWVFRPHYYILWLPFLALSAGYGLAQLGRWSFVALGLVILPLGVEWKTYFQRSPEEICRYLYPHHGFVEIRQIGERLRQKIPEGDKIAVIGSEPQVYFYARRSASTPHIYLYPMLESQPYAGEMQQEFIENLELDPPPFLVHVRIPTSWLVHPKSETRLLDWLPGFLIRHYQKREAFPVGNRGWEVVVYGKNQT